MRPPKINKIKMAKNLVEGLTDEIVRVTEIKNAYLDLPNNAGVFAAALMEDVLKRARAAQASGDIMAMMPALKELQAFEM